MARKPNPQPVAEVTPEVAPVAAPEVSPPAPKEVPKGPRIDYFGEGARDVKFTINPKATRYQVYASGMVVETL